LNITHLLFSENWDSLEEQHALYVMQSLQKTDLCGLCFNMLSGTENEELIDFSKVENEKCMHCEIPLKMDGVVCDTCNDTKILCDDCNIISKFIHPHDHIFLPRNIIFHPA
ncbi:hypothetical protein HK096_001691, partial [Nowakowskiella sp. JEL0078]